MLAGDIRKGVIFDDGSSTDPKNPSLYTVVDFQHVKPGKGAAFVRTTIKHLITGKVLERTYSPTDKINEVKDLIQTRNNMEYSYTDGDLYYFMDQETWEQIPLNHDLVEDLLNFCAEGDKGITIKFYNDMPIMVEPPMFVERTIAEAEMAVRGDTSKAGSKQAVLDTGYKISVPLFVNTGDKIRIDTRTGEYMERI